jgi:hypothetical protein
VSTRASTKEFREELELFRREVEGATQFFYGFLALENAAHKRKAVLQILNEAPTFWNTAKAAMQVAGFIGLHRVFDTTSRHNVYRLLKLMEDHPDIFSREALGERKMEGRADCPDWLASYLEKAYVPSIHDFRLLRKLVREHARTYKAKYKDIRDKFYAHREVTTKTEIDALFGRTNIREMQKIFAFLNQVYKALWESLENGHRLVLRPVKYSVSSIRKNRGPGWYQRGVQEIVVHEVDDFFDAATRGFRRGRREPR